MKNKITFLLSSILPAVLSFDSTKWKQRKLNEDFLGKTLLNAEELRDAVDFSSPETNPYPDIWYDTQIETTKNCYVEYSILQDGSEDRSQYSLRSLSESEYEVEQENPEIKLYLTHRSACGVCSNLDDLYVYLSTPDLADPVRDCSLRLFDSLILDCLEDIGFSEDCKRIWFWNAKNTQQVSLSGGCFGTCIIHLGTENNQPEGTDNPCEPLDEGGECGNTINGEPACKDYQWQNGEYRLNPCLQCDECRSGPIFQKIAGRTRRNSGIESAINRPDVIPIDHNYGELICQSFFKSLALLVSFSFLSLIIPPQRNFKRTIGTTPLFKLTPLSVIKVNYEFLSSYYIKSSIPLTTEA
eukprot:maker-scaffold_8-snap-gene-1.43-mRNA-1 protein AED:0.38 eAED:0.38 QI:0/0/0/0.5/1/1/2/0/354